MGSAYRDVPTLVLGGTGFIGAWTARTLCERGAVVSIAVRDPGRLDDMPGPLAPRARVLVTDLAQPAAVAHLVHMAAPAVVFNLAGYGVDRSERRPEQMSALNTGVATHVAAELTRTADLGWPGVRLVHAGSALEYGRLDGVLSEARTPNPTTDYGRTKLQGTRAIQDCCAASGLRAVIARLFTVYGPGEHPDRLLPSLMRTARADGRLELTSGRQRRNFTYVEDVVEGLLRLGMSAAAPGTVVNLASARLHTVREFAETAAGVLGIDLDRLRFGALPDREDEMWHGEVDISRLRALTSWVPATPLAEGIRRSWEMCHGA